MPNGFNQGLISPSAADVDNEATLNASAAAQMTIVRQIAEIVSPID